MSEPTEPTEQEPTAGRRGRPRPQETLERDEKVLATVSAAGAEGTTRDAVAAALGIGANEVYLSFFRLKRDGKIQRNQSTGKHVWTVVSEPVAAAA